MALSPAPAPAGSHWAFAFFPPAGVALNLGARGGKKIIRYVEGHVRFQEFLCEGTKKNNAVKVGAIVFVAMLGFVPLGPVFPNGARHINVDRAHTNEVLGPATAKAVHLNHGSGHGGYVREDCFDEMLGNRFDPGSFAGLARAFAQSGNAQQSLVNVDWNRFLFDSPTEYRFCPADVLINNAPGQTLSENLRFLFDFSCLWIDNVNLPGDWVYDHCLAAGLETQMGKSLAGVEPYSLFKNLEACRIESNSDVGNPSLM